VFTVQTAPIGGGDFEAQPAVDMFVDSFHGKKPALVLRPPQHTNDFTQTPKERTQI